MQSDTIADDARGNDEALVQINNSKNQQHHDRMNPVAELHGGQGERRNQADDGAQIRNDAQHSGHHPQQQGVVQPQEKKSQGQKCARTQRHQNLAAKENNQTIVDRGQNENDLLLETRLAQRQVIAPVLFDALFLEQKIEDINWN